MTEFTIEIWKSDKRKKEGRKLIERVEIPAESRESAEKSAAFVAAAAKGMMVEVHETYREVRNIMTGKIVKEHYLTPWHCSVGSETYFSS